MYIFELILLVVLGGVCLRMGWRIWKKEQITLIHDYHYTKVKHIDKKPYTEKMGKAMLLMGTGMCLTGLINFVTNTAFGWIVFGISFTLSMVQMIVTQRKYNGGIF